MGGIATRRHAASFPQCNAMHSEQFVVVVVMSREAERSKAAHFAYAACRYYVVILPFYPVQTVWESSIHQEANRYSFLLQRYFSLRQVNFRPT